jgi:hypothetical protein
VNNYVQKATDDCAKHARDDVNNCRRNRVQLYQGQWRGHVHAVGIVA